MQRGGGDRAASRTPPSPPPRKFTSCYRFPSGTVSPPPPHTHTHTREAIGPNFLVAVLVLNTRDALAYYIIYIDTQKVPPLTAFNNATFSKTVIISSAYLHSWLNKINWVVTCDFQQCGIMTSIDSDEPVHPLFMLRNSKCCSVSS